MLVCASCYMLPWNERNFFSSWCPTVRNVDFNKSAQKTAIDGYNYAKRLLAMNLHRAIDIEVRIFDRYLQSMFELQDGRMYNCNRFRERSMGMEQGRARIYSEASPSEIYGSPDSSAVGKTARASPCWQRSGLVSNLSRALEFTELRRSHWRSCASSKRLSRMSTKNGAGDQIWQYKTIHSINLTSFTCNMELVVDLHGFTKPINEFVLKELAALEVNNSNNTPVIILFEPPCDWNIIPTEYKVTNSWLQRNYHGIPWSSGNSPYEAVVQSFVEFCNEHIPSMSKAWRKKSGCRI